MTAKRLVGGGGTRWGDSSKVVHQKSVLPFWCRFQVSSPNSSPGPGAGKGKQHRPGTGAAKSVPHLRSRPGGGRIAPARGESGTRQPGRTVSGGGGRGERDGSDSELVPEPSSCPPDGSVGTVGTAPLGTPPSPRRAGGCLRVHGNLATCAGRSREGAVLPLQKETQLSKMLNEHYK